VHSCERIKASCLGIVLAEGTMGLPGTRTTPLKCAGLFVTW
jgi:hypothetical protein